jgi:hypothetical protein
VIPAPLQKFAEDRGLMQRHRGGERRGEQSICKLPSISRVRKSAELGGRDSWLCFGFQWLFGSKSLESKRIRARDAVLCAIDNTQEGNGGNW